MTAKKTPRSPGTARTTVRAPHRTTIPASKVGVTLTLTISDAARAELDRIQEETIKAAQEGRKFYWR